MSDKKVHRSVEEIGKEFSHLCWKLGTLEYQIDSLTKDKAMICKALQDLNTESVASQAAADKEQPKEESVNG